jgi:SRSO17 transposase
VEETFQFAKNETGLDHYQVRRYEAWYRHVTLSMLAAAFLAVTAATERDDLHDPPGGERGAPTPAATP